MKKIIVAITVCIAITLSGCGVTNAVTSETPIDADYVPAHDEIETTQEYSVDLLGDGGFTKIDNFERLELGWKYRDVGALCPVCEQEYQETISAFMKAGKEKQR